MRVFWGVLPVGNNDRHKIIGKLEMSSPRRPSTIELRMGIRFELSYAIFVIRFGATKIYASITGWMKLTEMDKLMWFWPALTGSWYFGWPVRILFYIKWDAKKCQGEEGKMWKLILIFDHVWFFRLWWFLHWTAARHTTTNRSGFVGEVRRRKWMERKAERKREMR